MKNLKTILVLCLCVILMSAFGTVLAQDETTPAFKVSEVVTDTTVTVITKNFPADTYYLVSLGDPDNADSVTAVAKFNSKEGGALKVTVKIPEELHGKELLDIILTDPNGGKIEGSFTNTAAVTEDSAEEPAAAEEPAEEPAAEQESAELPAAEEETLQDTATVCDYSVIPYVYIDSVVKDASVTFTTYNFPADSTFSVQMGVFNGTNPGRPQAPRHDPEPRDHEPRPEPPEPKPEPVPVGNQGEVVLTQLIRELEEPAPSFNRPDGPAPKPQPVASVPSFSGQEVGTYETGDGSSQTLTFDIPENLQGVGTIALWIADEGSCGFYAYNYFYNY